ncbi:hypothetical protein AnigIFM49718_000990 [Aspergillus niger]|nr:hypothetical protein AnigIFM49718_000990 [Aspergillus niger]
MSSDGVYVTYYTSWAHYGREQGPEDIPAADKLTHICYAFADIGSDGKVHFDPKDPDIPNYARQLKDAQGDKKLLLSIGGWSYREHFRGPASTDDGRRKFAQTAVALMTDLTYDGLDIDWEGISSADSDNFVKLLQECRKELDKAKREHSKREDKYHLFIATSASPDEYRNINFKEIERLGLVDYYSLMAYDFVTSSNDPEQPNYNGTAGHSSNLYKSTQTPAATPFSVDDAVSGYISGGVPPSKLLLGMPLYSHDFADTQGPGTLHTGCDRGDYDEPSPSKAWTGTHDFKNLGKIIAQPEWAIKSDGEAQAYYAYNETESLMMSFDASPTADIKGKYARKQGLAGGMWWESNGDYRDKDTKDGYIRTFMSAFESEN